MPNRQRSGRRIRLGSYCARLLLALTPLGLVLLFFLAALSFARAGSDGGNPQTAWALPQSVPAYLYQVTDVGGMRSKLDRQGLSLYEAIIVKADLQSSHLLCPTWLSLTAAQ
jgi:hypothetical protein